MSLSRLLKSLKNGVIILVMKSKYDLIKLWRGTKRSPRRNHQRIMQSSTKNKMEYDRIGQCSCRKIRKKENEENILNNDRLPH